MFTESSSPCPPRRQCDRLTAASGRGPRDTRHCILISLSFFLHRPHPLSPEWSNRIFQGDVRKSLDEGKLVHDLAALGFCLLFGPAGCSVLGFTLGRCEVRIYFASSSGAAFSFRVTWHTGKHTREREVWQSIEGRARWRGALTTKEGILEVYGTRIGGKLRSALELPV